MLTLQALTEVHLVHLGPPTVLWPFLILARFRLFFEFFQPWARSPFSDFFRDFLGSGAFSTPVEGQQCPKACFQLLPPLCGFTPSLTTQTPSMKAVALHRLNQGVWGSRKHYKTSDFRHATPLTMNENSAQSFSDRSF